MKPWKWEKINKIGKTRIAQSSFVFLFGVPVLARFMDESQYAAIFDFALPFSWVALYFLSLCVGLSTALYFWRCPDLVKRYRDFESFQIEGRGIPFLKSELRGWLKDSSSAESLEELFELAYEQFANEIYNKPDTSTLNQIEIKTLSPLEMRVIFLVCRDVANSRYPRVRAVAKVSYIIGFLLFGLVLLQNLIYVLEYLF